MKPTRFNIRVYGLLVHQGRILVTDEYRLNTFMTKFPGGALEFGEGTLDCLRREFMEELGLHIEIVSHFYTTDFFQQTELLPSNMQLINIYYVVRTPQPDLIQTSGKRFNFPETVEGAQSFRWLDVASLKDEDLTLPIDKHIVPLIREKIS